MAALETWFAQTGQEDPGPEARSLVFQDIGLLQCHRVPMGPKAANSGLAEPK